MNYSGPGRPNNPFGGTTDLNIGPNGELYGVKANRILQFDMRGPFVIDTIFPPVQNGSRLPIRSTIRCLQVTDNYEFYTGYNDVLKYSLHSNTIDSLGYIGSGTDLIGIVEFDGFFYGNLSLPAIESARLIRFMQGFFPLYNLVSDYPADITLVGYYDADNIYRLMVSEPVAYEENGQELPITTYYHVNPETLERTPFCDSIPLFTGLGYDLSKRATSYDGYLKHSELRIDLDWDDNSSRFGPHYYADPICTRSYRVADDDVKIRSWVGSPDAITVRLRNSTAQAGFDFLRSVPTAGVQIATVGDTLLRLELLANGTLADLELAMSRITLETTAPELMAGERIVETYVFADTVRSDMARSFIQVEPGIRSYAGPDTAIVVCPGIASVDMLAALGPGVDPGGSWFPRLAIWNDWHPTRPYGTYRYTTNREGCVDPDTAFITIVEAAPPSSYLPLTNTNVDFCVGDTLRWSVDLPTTASVVWEDGSTDRVRRLTLPGLYSGRITGTAGCFEEELIFLRLVDVGSVASGRSEITGCTGESFVVGGTTITSDTTIIQLFTRAGDCDSLHSTTFLFRKPDIVGETVYLCNGDTLLFGDQPITAAGNYNILIQQPGFCDTISLLDAILFPRYELSVDTILPLGDTLFMGSDTLVLAGDYLVETRTIDGCDSLIFVTLDFLTRTEAELPAGGYFAPTLLRQGKHHFTFHNHTPGPNRLKTLEVYATDSRKVFTADGGEQSWEPGGRDAAVPAGVYFYRATFMGSQAVNTGRIVVVR
jgi:hypothetical protein